MQNAPPKRTRSLAPFARRLGTMSWLPPGAFPFRSISAALAYLSCRAPPIRAEPHSSALPVLSLLPGVARAQAARAWASCRLRPCIPLSYRQSGPSEHGLYRRLIRVPSCARRRPRCPGRGAASAAGGVWRDRSSKRRSRSPWAATRRPARWPRKAPRPSGTRGRGPSRSAPPPGKSLRPHRTDGKVGR